LSVFVKMNGNARVNAIIKNNKPIVSQKYDASNIRWPPHLFKKKL